MLAHQTKAKWGGVEYETVVYVTEENTIRIYQYQFDGPEVLSQNCSELTLEQLSSIATSVSEAFVSKFLKDYKVD
tara:strand:- start:4816 stop:5040 length:225 start_codon:yes stop_codon:yes gene_type:complete